MSAIGEDFLCGQSHAPMVVGQKASSPLTPKDRTTNNRHMTTTQNKPFLLHHIIPHPSTTLCSLFYINARLKIFYKKRQKLTMCEHILVLMCTVKDFYSAKTIKKTCHYKFYCLISFLFLINSRTVLTNLIAVLFPPPYVLTFLRILM